MPENPAPENPPKAAGVAEESVQPAKPAEPMLSEAAPAVAPPEADPAALAEAEGMVALAPTSEAASKPVEAPSVPEAAAEKPPEAVAKPPEAPAKSGVAEGDFLEETVLPSTVANHDLKPGVTITWGDLTFTAGSAVLGGWYEAKQGDAGLLVKPGLDGSLLAGLGGHRLLPKVVYSGSEGLAVAAVEGKAVGRQLSLSEALEVVQPLAQLVYFLELKGLTIVDLEPRSLLQTEGGLRLVPPPRLAPIGEKAKPIWREGYTPPEVLAEASVSAKTGVYLIGALLFELLTGTALPVEGASELLLAGIPLPGVPQVLNQMLASPNLRAAPQEVMAQLKRLTQSPDPTFDIAAFTSVGLNPTRNYNEDAYSYRSERLKTQWNNTLLLRACVSDGMGGMASGELASQAAVETFVSGIAPHPIDDPKAQADWAVRLVWEANTAVIEALAGKDGGCTLSGVIFLGTRYVLGHVGDTRAYLWTPQNLKQLTRDHSLVATMIASGMITAEEAQHHPDRNKVLRSLGNLRQPQDNYVDTLEATMGSPSTALNLGEILLLVSDGVWGEVDDKDIAAMVAASPDNLQKIAEALVQAAIDAGAPDNATALLIKRRA